jgi:hypothetical protein
MPETVKGLIERVTYHNPENGFAVLKVQVKGRQDLATVVGTTTSVTAGADKVQAAPARRSCPKASAAADSACPGRLCPWPG